MEDVNWYKLSRRKKVNVNYFHNSPFSLSHTLFYCFRHGRFIVDSQTRYAIWIMCIIILFTELILYQQ